MSAVDDAKRRMEMADEILVRRLQEFKKRWAPADRRDAYEFERDLLVLMVNAMTNRTESLRFGAETFASYASAQFECMSARPLGKIMEPTK